ncbi:pyridoxamine 5'-phosphate oxidase family protein [Mycolicibacillus trivialis]|uniref:Uncharacterized protein n=1 Tax=Mycolicibacillus trivialis TaxID=1798 RepID=A0A1X2EMY0_9MYCO|nr:pyridoxamine 5'-phosphate oxidase family protein [Mycolicibacillus trivialis]ORX06987.1 hypothetical protein AWC30_05345 [Mycolicibacillus trivialis]
MSATRSDLDRLAAALADYDFAYLVTVSETEHSHAVAVNPVLREGPDGVIEVGAVGGSTAKNLARQPEVSLVWPPRDPADYSLFVDGRATVADGTATLVPIRAVLHRRAKPGSKAAVEGCLHDCEVLYKAG